MAAAGAAAMMAGGDSASVQTQPPRRVLVYRFGQLGDTLAALPSLWLLKKTFPAAEFTLLSEQPQKATHLAPENVLPPGLFTRFLKYRTGRSGAAIASQLRMAATLRRLRFDLLVYLVPSIRTPKQRKRDEWFFRLGGIRRRIGFDGFPNDPYPREGDGRLADVVAEPDALLHRLALDGLPAVPPGEGSMDLALTVAERSAAQEWWQSQSGGAKAPKGWFAVCSGSKWPSKQWPWERYREVGQRLIDEHGLLPVILGGPEDRELAGRLIAAWRKGLCAAGDLTVRQSAALLEQAEFYLGNDTGVMHLAAAVGTPCVGVFAAIDWPGRWHPYGHGHRVLRVEVPCGGCFRDVCPFDNKCLKEIGADDVYRACVEVWQRHRAVTPRPRQEQQRLV